MSRRGKMGLVVRPAVRVILDKPINGLLNGAIKRSKLEIREIFAQFLVSYSLLVLSIRLGRVKLQIT